MISRRFATIGLLAATMLAALVPAGARADVIVRDGLKQKFEASVKGVTPSTAKADGPFTFVLNWETESCRRRSRRR